MHICQTEMATAGQKITQWLCLLPKQELQYSLNIRCCAMHVLVHLACFL
jgi:hypothetical protein